LERIESGRHLRNTSIQSLDELNKARAEQSKWPAYNTELLQRIFDNESIAGEYNRFYGAVFGGNPTLSTEIDEFHEGLDDSINRLEAIYGRLELIPDVTTIKSAHSPLQAPSLSREVFVVHGHDLEARLEVARFLEHIDLRPIILEEQARGGRTIIEQIERHANVGFAVVLLTGDDVGAAKDKREELKFQARQNVILDLGYFLAKLGREKVCALHKGDIELTSDYHGVLYVKLDDGRGWRLELAREIKAAGIDVDLNKAFS